MLVRQRFNYYGHVTRTYNILKPGDNAGNCRKKRKAQVSKDEVDRWHQVTNVIRQRSDKSRDTTGLYKDSRGSVVAETG